MINFAGVWLGFASGIIGILIGLFFLLIFIWITVWLARFIMWISRGYRYSSRNGWMWWDHDDALEILRERYAGIDNKGAVRHDEREFGKIKAELLRSKSWQSRPVLINHLYQIIL